MYRRIRSELKLSKGINNIIPAQLRSFILASWLLLPCLLISIKIQDHKILFYISLFFTGYFLWTYFEYHSHRFWMHHNNFKNQIEPYVKHIHHHAHPTEIVITNTFRITSILVEILMLVIAGVLNNYLTILSGFVFGIISYLFLHHYIHNEKAYKIIPALVENHIHHHTKYTNCCFGITNTFWDKLNNTTQPKGVVVSETTVRKFYLKTK